MHTLIKIIRDDDGFLVENRQWHLVDPAHDVMGDMVFCTGEFFGGSESAVEFKTKIVDSGGIQCERCKNRLKVYRDVCL